MGTESADSTKTQLHFSDGVLDISELDEKESETNSKPVIDYKSLQWGPWALEMTRLAGTKTLQACDFLGESLASFFGITTPKYQFEINEYQRMKQSEEEAQRERDEEMGSWATEKITDITEAPPKSHRY